MGISSTERRPSSTAREGLNLQFAHIVVNYDLPWNPIRIDQRMGRLHRYGQERTVEVRNLFFDNTRESEILDLLITKTEQIKADLGMGSDVLGRILEELDLDPRPRQRGRADRRAGTRARHTRPNAHLRGRGPRLHQLKNRIEAYAAIADFLDEHV